MMVASGRKKSRIRKVLVNDVYEGLVMRVQDNGAYINILPGKDGFVHISQLSDDGVSSVDEVLKEGDRVKARVLEIDRQGRIRLTMRSLDSSESD